MAEDEHRLERIETKLDDLAKAVISLARMEERMITLFKRMDTYDSAQQDLGKRVRDVEDRTSTNGQSLRFAERLFWIVASAAIGYLFWRMQQ